MSFVDQVRAQPWYAEVASVFQQQNVPEYLWIATLAAECPSLACTSNPDSGGTSYGLFQLRQPGIGSPYSSDQLEDPVTNATIAAASMGAALRSVSADPLARLRAIEEAGWPGNDVSLGPNSTLLKEEPKRIGLLYETLKSMGLTAIANSVLAAEAQPGVNTGDMTAAAGCDGPSFWPCAPVFLQGVVRETAIIAIATAMFAGGIALMARGK